MRLHKKSGKAAKFLFAFAVLAAIVIGILFVIHLYYPLRHTDIINKYAAEYDLEPELIYAVIHAESKFDQEAESSKGARGLMQITESTAYWLAGEIDIPDFNYDWISDPEVNIRLGCYYLRKLYKYYGNWDVALCAYNAGIGNIDKWLDNSEYSVNGKTLKYVPFKETQNYIKRVSRNQKVYAYLLKIYK